MWIVSPSSRKNAGPAATGPERAAPARARSTPGRTRTSGFERTRTSPDAATRPAFSPPAYPRLRPGTRTRSAVPSRARASPASSEFTTTIVSSESPDTAASRRMVSSARAEAFFRVNGEAGAPFVLGFPNDRHRLAGERTLAYRSVEPAAQWARPVARPGLVSRLRRRFRRIARGASLSAGHDALAEILHSRPGWRTDRSRATLAWRLARPGAAYDLFELLDGRGRSRAYAAVRVLGDRALLADLQAADEEAGDAADLLDTVAEAYAGSPARTLVLRAGSASRLAARAAELGFSPIPTDTHFTCLLYT